MAKTNFKVGQLIRLHSRFHDEGVFLLIKYIPNKPLSKYWTWQALSGEELVDIPSYNEYQYEVVV